MRFTDYNITPPTFWEGVYCLLFYILISFLFYDLNLLPAKRIKTDRNYNLKKYILLLCISIFAITDFADYDFYYYYLYIKNLAKYGIKDLESVYDNIIQFVSYDYWGFRIVVWGSSSILLYQTFQINKLNLVHALYTFWVMYIIIFCYARVTLGLSILYFGYTLFRKSNCHSISGFILIISSVFFHRTMIIPAIISLLPLIKWNKRRFIISVMMIPIIVALVNLFISNYISELFPFLDETTSNKVVYYTNQQNTLNELTPIGIFNYILGYLIFFTPLILFIKIILESGTNSQIISNLELGMFQIAYSLCLISLVLDFIDLPTIVLAYRIRYMTAIPLCILLVSLLDKKIIKLSQYRVIMLMGFLYAFMRLYSVTKQSI